MLSEANVPMGDSGGGGDHHFGGLATFSSPGRPFDFGDLGMPTFLTPGRNLDLGAVFEEHMRSTGNGGEIVKAEILEESQTLSEQ